ncbi:phosphopantothenoylcysteine decarboxylase domain-containing protein [Pontiella sulfatireligans]|uniref:Coenzyme A biosynthesis bifunctional protein CoaBC n=1 Tax=Pontiella sulfatireligans TaxID=2750658 RepID=A0A6C2USQ6_9BACT|nr:phosphopantothenoylcysteine decarboxylase [Pontiella sulfatireligans]VGO23370.1 Coenzyme A biosynthesis bifunctional protein CoaBC [Pontiella sulfatireligans]
MNKRVLILSGPTHEYIDPVRFIGNASSGLMGKAIAQAALNQDCRIDFVTGPVAEQNLPTLGGCGQIEKVVSAEEMLARARGLFPTADLIIFAAAVADYAPVEKLNDKMPKSAAELMLRLRPTPDIAKTLGATKQANQIAIGFALQTSDGETNAKRKLASKNLDGIVLNTPASLGATNGTFSFLANGASRFEEWGNIDKATCAKRIFEAIRLIADRPA